MKRIASVLLVVILCGVSSPTWGSATIRYVRTDGADNGDCTSVTAPCATIEYALSKPSAGSNDTIRISSGIYEETLVMPIPPSPSVGLAITLSGGWDSNFSAPCGSTTTLTAPSGNVEQSLIKMFNNQVGGSYDLHLSCLSLEGNKLTEPFQGIHVSNNGQNSMGVSLDQCRLFSFPGHGLRVLVTNGSHMSLTLNDTLITDNSALANGNWSGIGMFVKASSVSKITVDLNNCRIERNVGDENLHGGGGISLYTSDNAVVLASMTNSVISDNEKESGGGGIALGAVGNGRSELTLQNCTVSGNRLTSLSRTGGGLFLKASSDSPYFASTKVFLKNTIVYGNKNNTGPQDIFLYENALNDTAEVLLTAGYSIYGKLGNENNYATFTDQGHNFSADPLLSADSHLTKGSPAIDAGQCGYSFLSFYHRVAPYDDMDGQERPGFGIVNGCDIGADEFVWPFPWPMFLPAIIKR